MKRSNSKSKAQSAFRKLGAVALITATLTMCFTACNQTGGGGNTGGGGGKPTPTPTPKPKHAINFSVEGTNGTLKAIVSDKEINSGDEVEEGKTVNFVAMPDSSYRVKEWKLDDTVVTGKTSIMYTHTVTKACTVKVSFEVTSVEGGAVLILSPNNLTIKVTAVTEDGSDITVEGCTKTTLANNTQTVLHATGTKVILKGKITELNFNSVYDHNQSITALNVQGLTSLKLLACYSSELTALNVQGLTTLQTLWCPENQLTALNVQGLTALQELGCFSNKLNAQAMTEILNALPAREAGDNARAVLYTERTNITEGNCKDYTQPEDLKKAFENAKKRKWTLKKLNASGIGEDL